MTARSSRGFTIVEILVSMAILLIVILGSQFYMTTQLNLMANSRTNATGTSIRLAFMTALQNGSGWNNTLNDNQNKAGSFACLTATGGCTGPQPAFKVLLPTAHPAPNPTPTPGVFYDPIGQTTAGFDDNGAPCTGFDAANGNAACPFRMQLSWEPVCTTGCNPPMIKLVGNLEYKPGHSHAFNASKWRVELYKNLQATASPTGLASCKAIKDAGGGTADGTYTIDPDGPGGSAPVQVFCDMTMDGGGWTLVYKATLIDTAGLASTGANNAAAVADIAASSGKLSDTAINAIATERFRVTGVDNTRPFSANYSRYFAKTTFAATGAPLLTGCSDNALTSDCIKGDTYPVYSIRNYCCTTYYSWHRVLAQPGSTFYIYDPGKGPLVQVSTANGIFMIFAR